MCVYGCMDGCMCVYAEVLCVAGAYLSVLVRIEEGWGGVAGWVVAEDGRIGR